MRELMPKRKHVDLRWERTRPLLFPGAVVALKIGERSYAREGSYRVARSATTECPCDGGDIKLDDSSSCVIDVRVLCTTCPSIFCCKHVSAARLSALKDGVERLCQRRDAAIPRHSRDDFPLRRLLSDSSVRALADAAPASQRIATPEAAFSRSKSAVAATVAAATDAFSVLSDLFTRCSSRRRCRRTHREPTSWRTRRGASASSAWSGRCTHLP